MTRDDYRKMKGEALRDIEKFMRQLMAEKKPAKEAPKDEPKPEE